MNKQTFKVVGILLLLAIVLFGITYAKVYGQTDLVKVSVDQSESTLTGNEYFFTLWQKRGVTEELHKYMIKMNGKGEVLHMARSLDCRYIAYKPVHQTEEAYIEQCLDQGPQVIYKGRAFGIHNRVGVNLDGHDFFIDGADNVYTIITNDKNKPPYGFSVQKQSFDGKLLFDWNSDDYDIDNDESPIPDWRDADWAHINSVDVLGPYILVSLRHTNSIIAIDERDGSIAWRLGGSKNDFTPVRGRNTIFTCAQHTARFVSSNIISIFDNGNHCRDYSRGVVFELNFDTWTISQLSEVRNGTYGASGGSYQANRTDSSIVAWGRILDKTNNVATEFNADGEVQFNVSDPRFMTYQIYRRYDTEPVLYLPIIER